MKKLLFLLLAIFFIPAVSHALKLVNYAGNSEFPDDFWKRGTPESVGLDSGKLSQALDHIYKSNYSYNIHSFIIIRKETIVFEYYGSDNGKQLTPNNLHKMASTTKSFTGALIGIAISEGLIKGVNARVIDYFKGSKIADPEGNKSNITIEDLLTMRSGLNWSEVSDNNIFFDSYDSAETVLSKPMECYPGNTWNYSSGNAQILIEILRKVTGKTPLEYAVQKLFNPIGITDFKWEADKSGTQYGGFGLFLKPRDLARFGYLYMKKGMWKGKQVVPASWVESSIKSHALAPWPYYWLKSSSDYDKIIYEEYGYFFWIPNTGGFATRGYQGQDMYVFPDKDLIVVFTCAAHPWEKIHGLLEGIIRDYILSAVKGS